jgi:hypothetical protein
LPRYTGANEITKADLNKLRDEVQRHGRLTVGPGLRLNSNSTGQQINLATTDYAPNWGFAELTEDLVSTGKATAQLYQLSDDTDEAYLAKSGADIDEITVYPNPLATQTYVTSGTLIMVASIPMYKGRWYMMGVACSGCN